MDIQAVYLGKKETFRKKDESLVSLKKQNVPKASSRSHFAVAVPVVKRLPRALD